MKHLQVMQPMVKMTSKKKKKEKEKKTIKIEIELEPIIENLNKYIARKVKQTLQDSGAIRDATVEIDFPDVRIHYPHIEARLRKLEDWKLDIEQGWIKLK